MSENFLKIKKKRLTYAMIASAAFGVCLALLCVGVLLLALKRSAIALNPGYYVLIAFASCAAGGGLLFFFLRPKDKKLAKSLDEAYRLGEKVQTMVEYRDSTDEMAVLQRENTNEVLGLLRPKKIKATQVIKLAIVPVLALALFFTGTFVPARVKAQPEPPVVTGITAKIRRVNQLIGEVDSSLLEPDLKEGSALVLTNLVTLLQNNTDENDEVPDSVVAPAVLSSVTLIDGMIAASNSANTICRNLASNERIKAFASAVINAAYYYRFDGIRLTDFNSVTKKYDKSETGIAIRMQEASGTLVTAWKALEEETLKADLTAFLSELAPYKTAGFDGEDALFSSLDALNASLETVIGRIGAGYSLERICGFLEEAANEFSLAASVALSAQSYRMMMDEYLRESLSSIFSVKVPALSYPELLQSSSSSSGGEKEPSSSSGGEADGDLIGGSKDTFYYPPQEEYVPYIEKLQEYDNKITEYIRNGTISEELADMINEYFDILANIANDNKNSN